MSSADVLGLEPCRLLIDPSSVSKAEGPQSRSERNGVGDKRAFEENAGAAVDGWLLLAFWFSPSAMKARLSASGKRQQRLWRTMTRGVARREYPFRLLRRKIRIHGWRSFSVYF